MAQSTAIEWTDATVNFWRGCQKVSPGCAHCYMFADQRRHGLDPEVVVRCSDSTFFAPVRARKWRALPTGSMVFTCSWSDFFHEAADEWRPEAWEVIRQRDDLIWQVLTKRPENVADRLPEDWGDGWGNVWMGVSIENRRWVGRADVLRQTPAEVRFISAEPLLGPLDGLDLTGIDWLIAGGESGPGHRRVDADWVRDLRDRCADEGVAFFFKQWGGIRPKSGGRERAGRVWDEMPEPRGVA
jgi:protein gp37